MLSFQTIGGRIRFYSKANLLVVHAPAVAQHQSGVSLDPTKQICIYNYIYILYYTLYITILTIYTYNLEYIEYIIWLYHTAIMWLYDTVLHGSVTVWIVAASYTQLNLGHRLKVHNSDGLQDILLRQGALSTAGSLFPLNMTKGCSQENAMANSFAAWHLLPSCKDCHSCQGENSQSYDRVSNRGIETTRNKITSTIIHLKSYWHTGHT